VFGYGSLIWNPGFPWVERRPAVLAGYHRAFCRYSFRHRGTPEAPGLVIGLREGGSCFGLAYRIAPGAVAQALDYLDGREGGGYHRLAKLVRLDPPRGDSVVDAWAYLPNTAHPSYFGRQDPERIAALVAQGRGESGTALDYLAALVGHLAALGVEEPELTEILSQARKRAVQSALQPASVGAPSRVG
jgi:cation transport protein ChaC